MCCQNIPFGNKSNAQKETRRNEFPHGFSNKFQIVQLSFHYIDRGAKHLRVFIGTWQLLPVCRPLKYKMTVIDLRY